MSFEEYRANLFGAVVTFVVCNNFHRSMTTVQLAETGRFWTAVALINMGDA